MPRPTVTKSILAIALAAPLFGTSSIQPVAPVTVHEWGTFTSVAGRNGESVAWAPLEASSDLPCFVHRMGTGVFKFVNQGLVRMETPVDYFYAQAATRVSVHVGFPGGRITEWYPKAINSEFYESIGWDDLSILPGANTTLPVTKDASRYFAARATDSAPLQAGDESEKFLFYRGMGNFKVPLEPVVEGNGVRMQNNGTEPIPLAILFENQKGRIGYHVVRNLKDPAQLYAPELTASFDTLRSELTAELEQAGLYPKEAASMIETWRDSWFGEGMRVIYLMPRATVDKVLPLRVSPAPKETQRVFVGRAELLSPWMERTIRSAIEASDAKTLDKFGRFLGPFLGQIEQKGGLTNLAFVNNYAQQAAAKIYVPAPCVQ